jgi:AcrR family transcriptional regulator
MESVLKAPRWERRKDSRPAELVRCALELFVERGFAATRLDDVARQAGVSKGTLYLYFSSKEDLFKACVRETIVPMIQEFARQSEQSDARSEELFRAFFQTWWASFGATKLSGIIKLIIAEANNFPEVARFFNDEVITLNVAVLVQIVQRGIDRGEFVAIQIEPCVHVWMAPLVLRAIWAQSVGLVCEESMALPAEKMIDLHVDQILKAIKP